MQHGERRQCKLACWVQLRPRNDAENGEWGITRRLKLEEDACNTCVSVRSFRGLLSTRCKQCHTNY